MERARDRLRVRGDHAEQGRGRGGRNTAALFVLLHRIDAEAEALGKARLVQTEPGAQRTELRLGALAAGGDTGQQVREVDVNPVTSRNRYPPLAANGRAVSAIGSHAAPTRR